MRTPRTSGWLLVAACAASCASTGGPAADGGARTRAADRDRSARLAASEARVAAVELDHVGITGVTVVFDVAFAASLPRPAVLARVDVVLSTGGRLLHRGAVEPRVALAAGAAGRASVRTRVEFSELLQKHRDLRPGSVVPFVAELTAVVETPSGVRRPVAEASGELPIPTSPRLEARALVVRSTAADRVAGVLRVDVRNDNAFPLDGDRLTYAVRVDGREIGGGVVEGRPALEPLGVASLDLPWAFDPAKDPRTATLLRAADAPASVEGTLQSLTPYGVLPLPVGASAQVRVESSPPLRGGS